MLSLAETREARIQRRWTLTAVASPSCVASSTHQIAGPGFILPPLTARQALRIVACAAKLADGGETGKLTGLGFYVQMALSTPTSGDKRSVRVWQASIGNILLAASGIHIGFEQKDWFYGTDYIDIAQSVGASPGVFNLDCFADVTNSDVAAHNASMSITALFEILDLPVVG